MAVGRACACVGRHKENSGSDQRNPPLDCLEQNMYIFRLRSDIDGVARGPQIWFTVDKVRKFHYLRDESKAGAMSNRRQPWDLQQL